MRERCGLRDLRTARKFMRRAGTFVFGCGVKARRTPDRARVRALRGAAMTCSPISLDASVLVFVLTSLPDDDLRRFAERLAALMPARQAAQPPAAVVTVAQHAALICAPRSLIHNARATGG